MAKREVVICDKCGKPGQTFVLWRDGDVNAMSVDLCETHARPVANPFAGGSVVDLPTRPRVRMEATPLRTTAKTEALKKEDAGGSQGAGE